MLSGFKQFILRGNVVDLAVGVMVGASFSSVVNALVKDIFTPFIGAIFKSPDFSGLTFTINESKFLYGDFINVLISFLIIAFTIYFFIVLPINTLNAKVKKEEEPNTKKCKECLSEIPAKATRCAFCTSELENKV